MMTLGYGVAGLSLDGSTSPGRQVLHLSVGHLQLAKAAAITGTSVSVSFDGGRTWHRARVSGRAGHCRGPRGRWPKATDQDEPARGRRWVRTTGFPLVRRVLYP
jgi:hypothetical protein